MSTYALQQKINELYNTHKRTATEKLQIALNVCTTADMWSCAKKSYLGITAHYINPTTLERESLALSCRRFLGQHTHDMIAMHVDEVHAEYGISHKVSLTITDNASNMKKAFEKFGISTLIDPDSIDTDLNEFMDILHEEEDEEGEKDEEAIEIDSSADSEDSFEIIDLPYLPNRESCACHTLNLISTTDSDIKPKEDRKYANLHEKVFGKLSSLWNRSSRSDSAHEQLFRLFKKNVCRPNVTRWNSIQKSTKTLLAFGETALNQAMFLLDFPKLSSSEFKFMEEYVTIMEPIASGIEILEATQCYYAILIPTIYAIRDQLEDMRSTHFEHCEPLLEKVITGLYKRFGYLFDLNNPRAKTAILATCSHPYFKMRWLAPDQRNKETVNFLQEMMVTEVERVLNQNERSTQRTERGLLNIDRKQLFFNRMNFIKFSDPVSSKIRRFRFSFEKNGSSVQPSTELRSENNARKEVISYFEEPCGLDEDDLEQLNRSQFRNLRTVFIITNVNLPSSAPVERLFSIGSKFVSINKISVKLNCFISFQV